MPQYVQFETAGGGVVLVEVEPAEVEARPGIDKAGLGDRVDKAVTRAQAGFDEAVKGIVSYNAETLIAAVRALSEEPSEAELTFGLKATGEVGNIAIAKGSAEANLSVRISWRA